jgi:dGTP triphosphohydrolase
MAGPLKDFRVPLEFKEEIDKIINLHFFRKLAGKTQVILSLTGPTVRTRLTHTVEVARIARKLCDELGLNSELAEAIALAHDLGHTPFGHVGERMLKEIMCGCDTLKGKIINDTDFVNSGFRHNLQSFRVLNFLEKVSVNDNIIDNKWPYIFWGVAAHSKMSWAKPYSGMENEILISCKHCDWVYSCFYHEKKECKRNIQGKKKMDDKKNDKQAYLCRPTYCATLRTFSSRDEVNIKIEKGENKEDFIGWFEDNSKVWCNKKCYLAELSAHKIKNREKVEIFPYFFDHPFPNSFYVPIFFDYFGKGDKDFISVEALIVAQADEIAQRQQDLEDAVSAKLITFKIAKKDVKILFNSESRTTKNQKELGDKIVKFYSKKLVEATKYNFKLFSDKTRPKINIYCLMYVLYSLNSRSKEKRNQWIIGQINELMQKDVIEPISILEEAFNINYDEQYFYFVVYHLLELDIRLGEYKSCKAILPELFKLLQKRGLQTIDIPSEEEKADLIKGLDSLINILIDKFNGIYKYFKEPKIKAADNYWQNLYLLNLYPFHIIHQIYHELQGKDRIKKRGFFIIDDLREGDIESFSQSYNVKTTFDNWKKMLQADSNRVLANFVKFTRYEDNDEDMEKLFKEFENKQRNYILKSEIVEKNDGKADYILRKLFSAFVGNSHQLPDYALDFILLSLTNKDVKESLLKDEKDTLMINLKKLKKTTVSGFDEIIQKMDKCISKLQDIDFNGIESSSEVHALLDKRNELRKFFEKFDKNIESNLDKWIRSEDSDDKCKLEDARLTFRGILDNPILNAMPFWKSLLNRGICDYIASLTDQEAIDQYEKLYASAMELI